MTIETTSAERAERARDLFQIYADAYSTAPEQDLSRADVLAQVADDLLSDACHTLQAAGLDPRTALVDAYSTFTEEDDEEIGAQLAETRGLGTETRDALAELIAELAIYHRHDEQARTAETVVDSLTASDEADQAARDVSTTAARLADLLAAFL